MPITHQWNGTVLTITSDSGTSSADLKGDDGVRGAQGIPGGTCYNVSQAVYNLLDNSDFRVPVNQRGITSGNTVGAWRYCIDRWANYSGKEGTITFNENGISFNFSLTQHLNNEVIKAGMKATAAVKWSDGLIQTATGTITKGSSWTWFFSGYNDGRGIGVVDNGNGSNSVRIDNDNGYTVEWAALYEGEYTADTLPAYQYKGYAAELAECMRYYQVIPANTHLTGATNSNVSISSAIQIPPMRTIPTITVNTNGIPISIYTDAFSVTTQNYTLQYGATVNSITINAKIDAGSFMAYKNGILYLPTEIQISADL